MNRRGGGGAAEIVERTLQMYRREPGCRRVVGGRRGRGPVDRHQVRAGNRRRPEIVGQESPLTPRKRVGRSKIEAPLRNTSAGRSRLPPELRMCSATEVSKGISLRIPERIWVSSC